MADRQSIHHYKSNIFHKMRPVHRVVAGTVVAVIAYLTSCTQDITPLLRSMLMWDTFSLTYIICCIVLLFTKPVHQIKKTAANEDGSDVFVAAMVVLSSLVSMATVGLLLVSKNNHSQLSLLITISGMILSWVMVHTVFTFHYAHKYYNAGRTPKKGKGGLDFPGEEDREPDYLDFAYFSFVIGCTFQVSDVAITSRSIRRLALLHGLLSFVLNTFVVALTVNMIAGLKK